jgi:hypothetical protein
VSVKSTLRNPTDYPTLHLHTQIKGKKSDFVLPEYLKIYNNRSLHTVHQTCFKSQSITTDVVSSNLDQGEIYNKVCQ